MATKNVTVTYAAADLYGVTSVSIGADNAGTPVHTDDDQYTSSVIKGIRTRNITINGVDIEKVKALVSSSAATLVCTLEGVDGGADVTATLINAVPHSISLNSADPGSMGTASVVFAGKASSALVDPLTIA